MAERIIYAHNCAFSIVAALDRAHNQFTRFNLDLRGSGTQRPLVLSCHAGPNWYIESLRLTQHKRLLRFPITTMRHERVVECLLAKALSLRRKFRRTSMPMACR